MHAQGQGVGVVGPESRFAGRCTRNGKVGLLATEATVASGAYERAITALRPDLRVHAQACPLFVPLVEEGWFAHPAAELVAREYLEPLRRAGVDVLVKRFMNDPVTHSVDSAQSPVATMTHHVLHLEEIHLTGKYVDYNVTKP